MAEPARRYDERTDGAPRAADPINPVPPLTSDPAADPRYRPANDPAVDNRTVVQSRSAGNGILIAALVVVLAVIAYFIFAPGGDVAGPVDEPAVTSEPAAPDATAPAAPADTAAPAADATAPDAAAPAAPAEEPAATAPADTAPATPAEPAPAQ